VRCGILVKCIKLHENSPKSNPCRWGRTPYRNYTPSAEDRRLARYKGQHSALAQARGRRIVFDLWHLVKLRIPYEEVQRTPLKWIVSVELNDDTFTAPWSLHEDTINHRKFCGEGEFDVKGFVDCIRKTGYAGPWGIEVLSEELRRLPLQEATTHPFQTTMDYLRS
jgi:sugar phosphate isomerase/epimerase